MRIVEQQSVEFTKGQPAAGGHFECTPVASFQLGRRVEGDRKRSGRASAEIDRPHLDDRRRRIGVELEGGIGEPTTGTLIKRIEKSGFLERPRVPEAPSYGGDRINERQGDRLATVAAHEGCER